LNVPAVEKVLSNCANKSVLPTPIKSAKNKTILLDKFEIFGVTENAIAVFFKI
jgi:hypothetical protein